jgi:Ala-tRNA(Pro) deacylase
MEMSQLIFEKICRVLDEKHVPYKVKTHEPASTATQAARARGLGANGVRRGVKAMVISADGRLVQCVVPGDAMVDLEKVKVLLGAKEVALASPTDVEKATDCAQGSVPPCGNLFNIPVYADSGRAQDMVFSGGLREKRIFMKRADWEAVVRPTFAAIGKKK